MTDLCNQFETEEISEDLGNVIYHGGNAEESGRTAVILKMPEEKSEDESDTEAHPPGDEKEGTTLEIFKLLQDRHPFWNLSHRLSKHFRLRRKKRKE